MAPPLSQPQTAPAWHGTLDDLTLLHDSVLHNCAHRADFDQQGSERSRCLACPACLLTVDQHALDRLAFVATLRERLLEEEVTS